MPNESTRLEGSVIFFEELCRLHALAKRYHIGCLMGKNRLHKQLRHLLTAIPESGCPMHDIVDAATLPNDSCGHVAGELCDLVLGSQHTMKNVKHGYQHPSDLQKAIQRHDCTDNYPLLMRVEVERKLPSNEWISSHSFVVIVHSPDHIHVLQAYVGHYTLAEYLLDTKHSTLRSNNNKYNFMGFLTRLSQMAGEAKTGKIYQEMFGSNFASRIKTEMRVSCRTSQFCAHNALENLEKKRRKILQEVERWPALICNSYGTVMKAQLYQHNKQEFHLFRHMYLAIGSKQQQEEFLSAIYKTRYGTSKTILYATKKKPSTELSIYTSLLNYNFSWSSFWTLTTSAAAIATIGGLIYAAFQKD